MAPVGCAVGPPITGQLTLEGIPILGLVDTGASVTCLGFSIWWRYRAQWGSLKQFEGTVHGAHGKPLQIAGRTQHLDIQWGEARGQASFIVIVLSGITALPHRHGYYVATPCPHRRDKWHSNPGSARSSDSPSECGPKPAAAKGNIVAWSWIALSTDR